MGNPLLSQFAQKRFFFNSGDEVKKKFGRFDFWFFPFTQFFKSHENTATECLGIFYMLELAIGLALNLTNTQHCSGLFLEQGESMTFGNLVFNLGSRASIKHLHLLQLSVQKMSDRGASCCGLLDSRTWLDFKFYTNICPFSSMYSGRSHRRWELSGECETWLSPKEHPAWTNLCWTSQCPSRQKLWDLNISEFKDYQPI